MIDNNPHIMFKQIVIIDNTNIPAEQLALLQKYSTLPVQSYTTQPQSVQEVRSRIGTADCVIVSWKTHLGEAELQNTQVKFICLCATTTASIDLQYCKQSGITVSNVTDYGDEAVAEWVFYELVRLFRGFNEPRWRSEPHELHGKSIGIIGLGAVGSMVARLALGFGMRVQYFSRTRKHEWESKGVTYREKTELLRSSDIVVVCTPTNVCALQADDFSQMHKTVLVNTSVGKAFAIEDLMQWIAGENRFVIIEKSASEEYHEACKDIPRVILRNLVGGRSQESLIRLGKKSLENVAAFLKGIPLRLV